MAAATNSEADGPADLTALLVSRGYHVLLLAAAVIGAPVALLAWAYLALVSEAGNWVWSTVPDGFGWSRPAAWYAVLVLGVAGMLVGLVIAGLPGRGGHLPVRGLAGGAPQPVELPGVALAALTGLVLGAVIGPEAPLTALGGGIVVFAAGRTKLAANAQGLQLLAVAGSAAAISTVFGNPLVAVVVMLEVVGLAGRQVLVVLLPCLLSAGIGALVFTGMKGWTGVKVASLTIPGVPAASLDWQDIAWTVPVAIVAAVGAQLTRRLGLRLAVPAAHRTVAVTTAAGLAVGGCAAIFTLVTDRSVLDVLESGEKALPGLVSSPHSWSIGALLLLLAAKGLAYGISLGTFRGGPTFPAVYLGAVLGILVAPLPGLGTTAGLAIGISAATTAVLRLPVTSVVLVVLLLGSGATKQTPVIMLAATVALVTAIALDRRGRPAPAPPQPRRQPVAQDSR